MSRAVAARLDSAGDVLITGPAVRAIAEVHDGVTLLCGPRGRAAAELLPGVDEIIEWQAPWVDFDSPELTATHVESLVRQLRDVAPSRMYIFTSFHQSPLPLALISRMPKPGAAGGCGGGPPRSVQRSRRPCGCNSQSTATCPGCTDSAPYLAALVESSCSASASVCAVRGSSDTSGPLTLILPSSPAR